MSRQQKQQEQQQRLSDCYKGSSCFVTGATGFLGKLLVEKLIRCLEVERVFILIREKKGRAVEKRLDYILKQPVFDVLRKKLPDFAEKITAIEGDCSLPGLGINEQDRARLVYETNYVFHCAATTRFDEHLYNAVCINIRGTRDLLALTKSMKNVKCFVHVSTAFANCNRHHIDEVIYEPRIKPSVLIDMVERLDIGVIKDLEKNILGDWPNTYTYTKSSTEAMISEEMCDFPLAIIRPSIVTGTDCEPLEGYIEGLIGVTGLSLAMGVGIYHVVRSDGRNIIDIVPADHVISLTCASVWDLLEEKNIVNPMKVYNCTSGNLNPITIEDLTHGYNKEFLDNYNTIQCIWYPFVFLTKHPVLHPILSFIFHTLPALIVDSVLRLQKKPAKLGPVYEKMKKLDSVLYYFMSSEWSFGTENTRALLQKIPLKDKQLFDFDIEKLQWAKYMTKYFLGIRLHIMKESNETIPQWKKTKKRLKLIHFITVTIFSIIVIGLLWYFVKFLTVIFQTIPKIFK